MKKGDLQKIYGVGPAAETMLNEAGFDSMEDMAAASFEEIAIAVGIPVETAAKIVMFARGYVFATKRKRSQLSPRVKFEVLKRDSFRCQYCGKQAEDGIKLEIDHIIPLSKGGTNNKENLITACKDCNGGKSSKELFGSLEGDAE